ncbi:MAG: hypothetical protein PHC61_13930 [Chitinivibrionales bacterium]|nr:hypothetical protein [Chitinivibrionales bacterium]
MTKNTPTLRGIADEIRSIIAATVVYDELMAAREAGSKPQTKEEFKRRTLNRLRQKFVEMVRGLGPKNVNTTELWRAIEKNMNVQPSAVADAAMIPL